MKKKIIGYTLGSFDLFHIGHLNILKKAKEQCDYLIVGINSDETIMALKNKVPIIPFDERCEIVRAIKYVDEVIRVDVPAKYQNGTDYNIRRSADIVFSGDDHKDDPDWQELIKYKETHGGKVVMFPYTKTTSSTIIREVLNERVKTDKK